MARIYILLTGLLISIAQDVCAQVHVVRGKVTDALTSDPIQGVTITVKGSPDGTITNEEGKYSLMISPDQILVFSAAGYVIREKLAGNSSLLDTELEILKDSSEKEVITGEFGLKRAASAMGASAQTLSSAEIFESDRENFVNSLQGRVAGVQISNSGGTPGSSVSVIIRGITSMTGNNQPLYVIDGIPVISSVFQPLGGLASRPGTDPVVTDRNLDFASRISDLDPGDIECLTVLKGVTAAALYGFDASNGAILITTKKGKNGKGVFHFGSSIRFDDDYRHPRMQTMYDNGMYGTTNYYSQRRFGAEYPTGTILYQNLENLFRTGITQKHNLSFESGNEFITFRAATGTTWQSGVIPTTDYKRNNISLSGTAKISDRIKIEGSFYFSDVSNSKISKGIGGVLNRAMMWPLTDDMSGYLDATGKIRYPDRYADLDILNPYFDLYKNKNYDKSQRFISNVVLDLNPFKNLLIHSQVGYDISAGTFEIVRHPQWSSTGTGTGSYDRAKDYESWPSVNFIVSYRKNFGRIHTSAFIGYHQFEQSSKIQSVHGEKFMVADVQSISNCDATTLLNSSRTLIRRVQAVSGSFEFSYQNLAFLTLRGRNDWTSTLPAGNNRFFSPAADASVILSELPFLKSNSETINYLKLRGSVTKVGRDVPPLSVYPVLELPGTSYGGYRYGNSAPNLSLRPEMNLSWEAGFEARLFRNLVDLDLAYYNTVSKDQLINGIRLSYASGSILNNMNAGSFKTNGVEMNMDVHLIKNRDWLCDMGIILFRNWSEMKVLPDNLTEYYNSYSINSGNIRNGMKVGYPVTSLTGIDYQKNSRGQILIDPSSGLPLASTSWTYLADREPRLNFGYEARINFKNFSLKALLDGKYHSAVVNGTKRFMMQYGFSKESVIQREAPPVVFDGVLKDGYENTDNPTPNSIGVRLGDLQYGYSGQDPDWIEKNVNYLRMAELRFSYSFDRDRLMKSTGNILSAASLFISGTDLFTCTNYTGSDPAGNSNSAALGGTGGAGQDVFAIAPPLGISFGFNVSF